MSLVSKPTDLRDKVLNKKKSEKRGDRLVEALVNQINAINSIDYFNVLEVEELLLKEHAHAIEKMKTYPKFPKGMVRFSPSGASKCERELFFKAVKATQDEKTGHPFQRRWTRNSTAVHGAMQKQLLESEVLLDGPEFKVVRLSSGLPAWEKNIEKTKIIEHNGVTFCIFGMCDGILEYKDGTKVGFEYKTKSNSVAQIKQVKDIKQYQHQLTAYSILFGVNEWLVNVESVAKDKWSTGSIARDDFKVFYHKVSEADKKALLDKWARVAANVDDGELSKPDYGKCLFCPFKSTCQEVGM
ncbi:PD-(D/E)XK nuclease family protein [Priestia aryabhattai]|uniref:PD-(D/E)XK nuclease family protein n=1 Tax=Priestia aryabhattai TaxID=412384 RepID=UPI003D2E9358